MSSIFRDDDLLSFTSDHYKRQTEEKERHKENERSRVGTRNWSASAVSAKVTQ